MTSHAQSQGEPNTTDFRVFIQDKSMCVCVEVWVLHPHKLLSGGTTVSPWHDIPLKADGNLFHFVCEIPKETAAKMEVATVRAIYLQQHARSAPTLPQDEEKTPIKQDIKKGNLRFYPYNINWNYGLLPQTWEDPSHANADLGGVMV